MIALIFLFDLFINHRNLHFYFIYIPLRMLYYYTYVNICDIYLYFVYVEFYSIVYTVKYKVCLVDL